MKNVYIKILLITGTAIFTCIFLLSYTVFLFGVMFYKAHENNFNASSLEKDTIQILSTEDNKAPY